MPVTAADLKFFAAQTMLDTADGGGPRGSSIVQSGIEANIFPNISAADRGTGRVHLRKVYPSLTNADTAALLGASVAINEVPTDPNASVVLFATGNALTTRAQAVESLKFMVFAGNVINDMSWITVQPIATLGSAVLTGISVNDLGALNYNLGKTALISNSAIGSGNTLVPGKKYCLRRFVSYSGQDMTLDAPMPFAGAAFLLAFFSSLPGQGGGFRAAGVVGIPGAVAAGAVTLDAPKQHSRIAPVGEGDLWPSNPTGGAYEGLLDGTLRASIGNVQTVFAGDISTLWHETATTPATATNGGTVNTGRTDLDQLAIVGANGKEIIRFLAGGPIPAGAPATVNLTTGVVTFVNVAGWSQPVTVRHRIAHRSAISAVVGATVTLATPTTRAFPAGAVLSTHLPLGDLFARAYGLIAQQAWTRVWSDSLIGNPVPMMFNGTIVCTNAGAESDRWAIVFDSGNTFKAYSERLGQVASGNTATDFAPINPATGAAFFMLPSAGWAAEILVGSVLRFNTSAAAAPVWALRCVSPSAAAGTVNAALRMHGSV